MNNWDHYWTFNDIKSFGCRYHHNLISGVYFDFLEKKKISNPSIVEVGCGCGEFTARMLEKFGGNGVLIDKSSNALKVARNNFKSRGLDVEFKMADLFKLDIRKKFDIVHSEGLIEHFKGEEQKKVVDVHKKLLKKGGFLVISVPRPSMLYRIWRFYKEKRNDWPFGYEKAMTKEDLRKVLKASGFKILKVLEKGRYSFALAKI